MDGIRKADAYHHGKDDGNGGEADSPPHNQRNEEVVFTPLNNVVDADENESPDESSLCQSYEHCWYGGYERTHCRDEFTEAREYCERECIWHAQNKEGCECEEENTEAEHELAPGPLGDFSVHRFRFPRGVQAVSVREEAQEPSDEFFFLQLHEEGEDKYDDQAHKEIHD